MGEKVDVHALRHTAASRMLRSGVSLVHAQRIPGHADPRTISRVYTHLGVEDLRAAVESMDRLRRAPEKARGGPIGYALLPSPRLQPPRCGTSHR